jgi:hypothetical protein
MHCATRRRVSGSIPDGDLRIFHLLNPSDRTMALASSQPITEMSTRGVSWRVNCRCLQLTTLPPSLADCPEIPHAPASWNRRDLSRPLMGNLYLY